MCEKYPLKIVTLFFSIALCLTTAACGASAGKGEGTDASLLPSSAGAAEREPDVAGCLEQNKSGTAGYIGLYQLTGHMGKAPFTFAEIPEDHSESMYLYDGESLVSDSPIDYSEQRALNGNHLMVISMAVNDKISEIGIWASYTDGQAELHMRGYGGIEGFEGTFEKIDGTMFLQSEDKATDYLLEVLQSAGYGLEETAVIGEDADESFDPQGVDCSRWFFAWGRNGPDKFTAEEHFAVTAARQVWQYDVLSDGWTRFR